MARPLTVLICPVNETLTIPLDNSQNFIILSFEPVTNLIIFNHLYLTIDW